MVSSRILVDTSIIDDIEKLIKWISPIPFDSIIADSSALIYRNLKEQNKLIEFRDIFIAATAVANNLCLATLNIKHFKRVENIKLYNIDSD